MWMFAVATGRNAIIVIHGGLKCEMNTWDKRYSICSSAEEEDPAAVPSSLSVPLLKKVTLLKNPVSHEGEGETRSMGAKRATSAV